MPPAVAGRPRACPASTEDARRNKGVRYPADPPTIEEIVAVMRAAGDDAHGHRLRALIVVLWRAGLRACTSGLGYSSRPGRAPARAPSWTAPVRHQRPDPRPGMVRDCRPYRAPPDGHRRGRAARFAPHQLCHAHALEMAHEGVPLVVIQRQLGHGNLGITSVYQQGIDNAEVIEAVHSRRAPMVPVSATPRI